jgi:AGZA family xanthine/uracil permease-like MFS transporter
MRWFVRGDIDGFFGLALDNLVQLLVIVTLCSSVLGFGPELIYGRILPGAAVSLVLGNLFYAWQAKKLAEKTGRDDVCALPYGINTVSLFAHIFLVMLPVKPAATAATVMVIERKYIQAGMWCGPGFPSVHGGTDAHLSVHLRGDRADLSSRPGPSQAPTRSWVPASCLQSG